MENQNLSAERSLQLISEMIEKNRKDLEKDAGNPMILWGSITALISVAVWLLIVKTGNPAWNFLWFSIPLIGYPIAFFLNRDSEKRASTYLDRIIGWVWTVFGIVSICLSVTACFIFTDILPSLTPMILISLGICTSITGFAMNNKVIGFSGVIVALAASILCFILPSVSFPLILCGSAVIALVIPGLLINLQQK